jgi:hypothetical protein
MGILEKTADSGPVPLLIHFSLYKRFPLMYETCPEMKSGKG